MYRVTSTFLDSLHNLLTFIRRQLYYIEADTYNVIRLLLHRNTIPLILGIIIIQIFCVLKNASRR